MSKEQSPSSESRLPAKIYQVRESDLHYEHFAQSEPSIEVNRGIVQELMTRIPNGPDALHIDVATGTGLVPALLREEGYTGVIVGIDPNRTSLAIARQKEKEQNLGVLYIEGYGQNLSHDLRYLKKATSTTMNDAIHEVGSREEQQAIFTAISEQLEEGGYFSFNSAFTTLALKEGRSPNGRWWSHIVRLSNLPRNKNPEGNGRVTGITENPPEIYSEMLAAANLKEIYTNERKVIFNKSAIEAIAMYPRFTQSFFDNLIGQENLSDTQKVSIALEALKASGIDDVPRIWYESISQKVSDPKVE